VSNFHNFNILNVNSELEIQNFLSLCNTELKSFRYFSSRPISIFKSHVFTYLVYDGSTPIAYYHLDRSSDIFWFGICVLSNYQNFGIGKLCIQHLLLMCQVNSIHRVNLSVDLSNTKALSLYLKSGFKINEIRDQTVYMNIEKNY